MAVTEPPGDFDYLWEDPGEADDDFGDFGFDDDDEPYEQPRVPWYRTTAALLAICAIVGAVLAILVSAVLLLSRGSGGSSREIEPTIANTPSSAPATKPPMIATVPPSPTPSPSSSAPTASAPVIAPPRGREPATGQETVVNPTPITRMPYSVSPEPHPAFPHY